ncbi:MAG TPA: hypothetical protein PKY12_03200, partial [Catalimonadaceae bacterium]|nr:hypothetical protein [Catalimonadaceae bacterium]
YLMPLDSVSRYIQKYHHLPEVPSAKEVAENGIKLAEMNALLLKKIEELTLHLIDLKNEVEQLKRKN